MKNSFFIFLFFTFFSFAFIPSTNMGLRIRNDIDNNSSESDKKAQILSEYAAANTIYTQDFEGTHGWTFVNGTQANKWFVGTAVNNGGAKSLYISDNDGAANQYNTSIISTSHAYKDIAIPANTVEVKLSFDWRSMGNDQLDNFKVWIVPTSFLPGQGAQIFPDGDRIQVGGAFSTKPDWANYSTIINLSAYAGQTMRLVFQWNNIGWMGLQPPAAVDNIVLSTVSCSAPSSIQAENITTTTAQLSWTAPNGTNIASYDYYISTANNITDTTVPTGNITTTSVNLGSLTSATQYYFWVRSNCGTIDGQSVWTGPFTFLTSCLMMNLPYTETFNSDSSTVNCWSVINNNNDAIKWSTNMTLEPFEGDRSANIPLNIFAPVTNDDYLVSPVFNFNGAYQLKYYYKVGFGMNPQKFSVKMSQNGGVGVTDFTETIVAEQEYSNMGYIEKIVYLPTFTGQGALAWYVGNSNNRQIFIDKVVIEPVPACPVPYEVIRTQLTSESVSLTWQQYSTVSSWEVIVLPHGQTIPDDLTTVTIYQTTTNSITINGIESSTDYDLYVRAVCSPVEQSDWSTELEIRTPPSNDECDKAIMLTVNPGIECVESVSGTVIAATPSNVGGLCWGNPYNDVWYEFVAISENQHIVLQLQNPATTFIALYDEDVCNEQTLAPIACAPTSIYSLMDLTVGKTYKLRIYSVEFNPSVNFNICIRTQVPPIQTSEMQYTIPELVTEVLIDNPCANISNISWSTGTNFNDVNGIGYFNKAYSDFPFNDGIILSTGKMLWARGSADQNIHLGGVSWPGDAQLTTYINDYLNQPDFPSYNASVLEFDFVALTNELKLNFLFASNEYGGFQCAFGDSMAFFLTNTTTGVTTNIGVVPDTTDPISASTIRKALHSYVDMITGEVMCGDVNPEYFKACYDPAFNGQNPLLSAINFLGLTVPMTAKSTVIPGTTYHLKLVIQDRADSYIDSAVFIEGSSFNLGNVELGNDLLVESGNALCSGASYVIDSGLNSEAYTIQWYKDNVLINGATGATLEVTQGGEYKIEAAITGTTCVLTDTIKVEIYPEIKIVPPKNIEVCVFNQSIPAVDLTIIENEMLSLLSELTDIEVGYYETQAAANLGIGALTTPENYQTSEFPKEIFVRIDNTKTGCHRIVSFKLVQKVVVNLKKPENIVVCVYDGVRASVDLTTVKAGIVSQLANPDVTLRYYKTYGNAINEVGAIASPQNYEPATLPATVYIRFTDRATGCELLTSVDVLASPKLTPMEVEDVLICNKYVVPQLPEGYFYSTEEFGKGQIIKSGAEYNPGSYKLYINIQNSDGCIFNSSYTVEVIDCSIPKGISPNGDGLNDSFDLKYHKPLEIVIYNRYGMEVYSYGTGYTNQWYGQNKEGKPLPDGTYFYKVTTANEVFTGYVQLVREIK